MVSELEETMKFQVAKEEKIAVRQVLTEVSAALTEKGYNPINQLVGYLLSGDPAFVTSHKGARNLMRRLERDELLEELLRYYLEK